MPLGPDFLPRLDAIAPADLARSRVLLLNYPNNPTSAVASAAFFQVGRQPGPRRAPARQLPSTHKKLASFRTWRVTPLATLDVCVCVCVCVRALFGVCATRAMCVTRLLARRLIATDTFRLSCRTGCPPHPTPMSSTLTATPPSPQAAIDLCRRHGILLIHDNPYVDLVGSWAQAGGVVNTSPN